MKKQILCGHNEMTSDDFKIVLYCLLIIMIIMSYDIGTLSSERFGDFKLY
jgi:hypothetical protein